MLSKKMAAALNKQINAEMYSSYLYLSMSAYFESTNLPGSAKWMAAQAKEETGHAMKMYGFVHDRLSRVTLAAIEAPPAEWESPLAVFEDVLAHEQKVTAMINDLVALAAAEKDAASGIFLQWFVTEQVEEEKHADSVIQQLKRAGDKGPALLMLDHVLGQRS